jgi:hypothetical protein
VTMHLESKETTKYGSFIQAITCCGITYNDLKKGDEHMILISPDNGMLGDKSEVTCEACILIHFQEGMESEDE